MYYGNRGVHPSVAAAINESRRPGERVIGESHVVEWTSDDPIMGEFQVIGGVLYLKEGESFILTEAGIWDMAKNFLGSVWNATKSWFQNSFGKKIAYFRTPENVKQFTRDYINDPEKALGGVKKSLEAQGTSPEEIQKHLRDIRRSTERVVAMRDNLKTRRDARAIMAMAQASKAMASEKDPQKRMMVMRQSLGNEDISRASDRQQQQQQKDQPAKKPEAKPTIDPQDAAKKEQARQQQKQQKPITIDGRFYDGQSVQAFDNQGQVVFRGRVRIIPDDKMQTNSRDDFQVVSDDGKKTVGQSQYQWKPIDLKDSPPGSPDHKDPEAAVAAPPKQEPEVQPAQPQQVEPEAQPAPAPVEAPASQAQPEQPQVVAPAPPAAPAPALQPQVNSPAPTAASSRQRQRMPIVDTRPENKRLGKIQGRRTKPVSLGEWVTKHFGGEKP